MGTKTAVARHQGGLKFAVETGSGHSLVLDNAAGNSGPRPTEVVLAAQAGCTAMDVISILQKKRQTVTRYEVFVTATQRDEHPDFFTRADIVHEVEGPVVEEAAVRRAIELSATKYCSVAAMLSAGTVELHHRYRICTAEGDPIEGDVMVTGPNADPIALAASMDTPRTTAAG